MILVDMFGAMSGETQENLFERGGICALLECSESIAGKKAAGVDHSDTRCELLNFRKRVRGKEDGGYAGAEDFGFEVATKFGGGDGVEAAGWFVKQENLRLMEQRAGETQALDRSGGESANLAVESFGEVKLIGECGDTLRGGGGRKLIEAAKKEQIFAAGEAWIEAVIGAGVIAEAAADVAGIFDGVVTRDRSVAARWNEQG